jgi:polyhydroxyalkanoate synthase
LLDWGYPDQEDYLISIQMYVQRYLKNCVQFICQHSSQKRIDLLGICQGGLLSLLYSLIYNDINRLVLISCPIDFHTRDNTISHIFRKLDVDALKQLFGNIPGLWLTQFFITLRPFELIGKKYLKFIDQIDVTIPTEKFLQVEKWLYDAPDQTAQSFYELITEFYQQNKLIRGEYQLAEHKVKLSDLNIPILNVMAKHDEIIPISATRCLRHYIQPQLYTQYYFNSGHIGIYISDKVGNLMPNIIAKWLKA